MGICQYCYQQATTDELKPIKTLNLKAGPEFNAISFSFTNRPLTELKGECLIFYADHVKELSETQALSGIHRNARRKLFEYLTLAEEQSERNHMRHFLIPISIPAVKFSHMMFVKMQPWDGGSKYKIERKIYQLTVGYLESFKLRGIENFTIVEFDLMSGVHYSLSFPPISRALQDYSSDIRSVNILCNSVESIEYYYRKIRYYNEKEVDFEKSNKQIKEKKSGKSIHENKLLF